MRKHMITVPAAALLGLLLTVPGCATMGTILIGRPDDLYGQVRAVDARRGFLQITEDRGREFTLRYDEQTRVVYDGRSYAVASLHWGDEVRVRVEYDRYFQPWADLIELRAGGGIWGNDGGWERDGFRVEHWNGRVQLVDYRGGWFVMERGRHSELRIHIGRYARGDDIRRFERLRRGDRVKVEVRTSYPGQAELVRFR
ncbi:MAG: hypothetical protein FIB01_08250 [Gemmatimonadetes bacterium]|nr:hypothetical protein [Gemmatimonadota bacterium]